jgi:hypothetical protein
MCEIRRRNSKSYRTACSLCGILLISTRSYRGQRLHADLRPRRFTSSPSPKGRWRSRSSGSRRSPTPATACCGHKNTLLSANSSMPQAVLIGPWPNIGMCVSLHACMHAKHTCIHACIHTYSCSHACMHAYVSVYVCMRENTPKAVCDIRVLTIHFQVSAVVACRYDAPHLLMW